MSYIGSTPTTQSFIAGTDYFNGTGSQVAFTLSRSVNSVNDIEVIVNNVEQIPSGYLVSGTTLTFSAAPSSGTSNVYVRYLSTTNLSLAIPAGTSASFNTVTATSLTATDLTVTNGASIQGLTVGRGAGAVATNTALGITALAANTSGDENVGVGHTALNVTTTGSANTAVGSRVMRANTTGGFNAAFGYNALLSNTTGSYNTAVGAIALQANTTGGNNTAVGYNSSTAITTGIDNVSVGYNSLSTNAVGSSNTAIGRRALFSSTVGENTAVGFWSLTSNTTGTTNTAVGMYALQANTTASNNTAVGYQAGYDTTTGRYNAYFGKLAGANITTGEENVCIGYYAGNEAGVFNLTTQNLRIVMGQNAITNAYIKVAWTVTSDARDKTNINPIPHGLEFVKQLNPVSYNFKKSREDNAPHGSKRYGFLAQDILALEGADNVIIDNEQPDHLKYQGEALVPVLVKAIQELKAEFDAYKEAHP